jgi:hypothetical protein
MIKYKPLPTFNEQSDAGKQNIDPIYSSLFDITFKSNDESIFEDLLYLNENTTAYDLNMKTLTFYLNYHKNLKIKELIKLYNKINKIIIDIHDIKGSIINKKEFKIKTNSLLDFKFCQN